MKKMLYYKREGVAEGPIEDLAPGRFDPTRFRLYISHSKGAEFVMGDFSENRKGGYLAVHHLEPEEVTLSQEESRDFAGERLVKLVGKSEKIDLASERILKDIKEFTYPA